MAISEFQALSILKQELATARVVRGDRLIELGIGDDCALLRRLGPNLAWTVDSCAEGSHYLPGWLTPAEIAHKSLHAAVSDVCAMGMRPRAAVVHLTLSETVNTTFIRRFARAQARLSEETGVAIVGGNIASGPTFSVVTSVLGEGSGTSLRRDTAVPGDEVWLCGQVGMARAGLLLLQAGKGRNRGRNERACLDAFARPQAQLAWGRRLLGRAHACLDVSDGLIRDTNNLAAASGVRIVLSAQALVGTLSDELLNVCETLRIDPLGTALHGGEDYCLLATGPRDVRPRGAQVIGRIIKGHGVMLEQDGKQKPLRGGFEHA